MTENPDQFQIASAVHPAIEQEPEIIRHTRFGETMLSVSCIGGTVHCWSSSAGAETQGECTLALAPGQIVVIGRQQGGRLEYIDPSFVPTKLVPDTGQSVLTHGEADNWVSRGHFTLRGSTQGILLINGVPGVDGGIRPPTNWTLLMAPTHRMLESGEEYLIERGACARIQLPNATKLLLRAS